MGGESSSRLNSSILCFERLRLRPFGFRFVDGVGFEEGLLTSLEEEQPLTISPPLAYNFVRWNFVPAAVLTKSGKVPVNIAKQSFPRATVSNSTARYVNTAASKQTVNVAKSSSNVFHKSHSPVQRTFTQKAAPKNSVLKGKVNTAKGNPQYALKDQGSFDSGCSRHMTGNKFYLSDYQDIDGGFTECLVLSPDFKLLDESQVLLKVPRHDNMYNFDLKNIVPSEDLPYGKKAIGTKWVFRNKKDQRGIVVRNKDRLVAQGRRQEKGIDYDKVFAPVARIEEIRFRRGTIDKTLFNKKIKNGILLIQVYVDDIIFGSTKKSLSTKFEQLMHKRFQMSSMRELTFFLGLQVEQRKYGIFISHDKYVCNILKKFSFSSVKTASTPMETHKPLSKDADETNVDVHLYSPNPNSNGKRGVFSLRDWHDFVGDYNQSKTPIPTQAKRQKIKERSNLI
nr:retrotransposon protein, putative, unclassified [Tanacetum cinerariifolium]